MNLDERDWDEREYESDSEPVDESKLKSSTFIIPHDCFNETDYPIDLWHLVSIHIAPEDILRFALISKRTYCVVNTVAFWIRLFRKHTQRRSNHFFRELIKEPFIVIRRYVIRSLFESYPLFRNRLGNLDFIQTDPHFLRSYQCVRNWHIKISQRDRTLFHYYFEFRSESSSSNLIRAQSSLIQKVDDYQIDEKTRVLHIISKQLVPIGRIMGRSLTDVLLKTSTDFHSMSLRLTFDSNVLIIIDPVCSLKIYSWFDCPARFD